MNHIYSIAFTHKNTPLSLLGKLHIAPDEIQNRLATAKNNLAIKGLMFLSTCNRAEFIISHTNGFNEILIANFLQTVYPFLAENDLQSILSNYHFFEGKDAVKHLMQVSSSLDSMLIGEREIITQFRKSYEVCNEAKLTDDVIRLVVSNCIETAKKIYTDTRIAHKQISIVALAFEQLKKSSLTENSNVLIIGAGQTNATMCKFLQKFGVKNIHIFNRNIENAQLLANDIGAKAYSLAQLENYTNGFDVLIYCTAAQESLITPQLYIQLLQSDKNKKVVVDLSIPNGVAAETLAQNNIEYISIEALQIIANKNIQHRMLELENCESIIIDALQKFEKTIAIRKVELAMTAIPEKVKMIKHNALNNVFAKEIEGLDENSKEVLSKIFDYVEKKYIAVPMKLAREILLQQI